jgi:6-phosphogluconate dehydrogenase
MELAMIGLGRMGANMAERLVKGGHKVVGYDPKSEAVEGLRKKGGAGASSLEETVSKLPDRKIVWLMVPSGKTVDETIDALLGLLKKGDILIDGGNSHYTDTLRRAKRVEEKGLAYVDCGTSGGIWGLKEGYCMMVGGDEGVVDHLRPIFETLAPGPDKGWGRVGPVAAGHFVKMVHNGVEYGMMQAYAEGFDVMKRKEDFTIDLHQAAEIWRFGSVVRSWLLDLAAEALKENPEMKGIAPYVADTGEGRWTALEAIHNGVSAPVMTLALYERFRSRDDRAFADSFLAVLRNKFGGHPIKTEK